MGKRKGKGRGHRGRNATKRKAAQHDDGRGLSYLSPPASETSHSGLEHTTTAVNATRDTTRSSLHESLGLLRVAHAGPKSRILIQHFDRCQHVDNSTRSVDARDVTAQQLLHFGRVLRISFVKSLSIDYNIVCVNMLELMQHAHRQVRASRLHPFLNHDAVMLQRARERRGDGGVVYYVRGEHTQVYRSVLDTWTHWCQQESRLAMEAHDDGVAAQYHKHVVKMERYAASLFAALDALGVSEHDSREWFPQIRAWDATCRRREADPQSGDNDNDGEGEHFCRRESSPPPSSFSSWEQADGEEDVERLSRSKGVSVAEMRAHMRTLDVVSTRMTAIKAQRNASSHQLSAYTVKQYVELLSDPRGVELVSAEWRPTPHELRMWTLTVRLFFGDLFAGGQCSFDDADEDLRVYCIHNTMAATNEEHDSHDGQSVTTTGVMDDDAA